MKKIIFTFCYLISCVQSAGSSQVSLIIRQTNENSIQDLILNPEAELQLNEKTGKSNFILKGIYFRESWDLNCNGRKVSVDPEGVFLLRVPYSDKKITVECRANGPGKQTQFEKIQVLPLETNSGSKKEEVTLRSSEPVFTSHSEDKTTGINNRKFAAFYAGPVIAIQKETSQKSFSFGVGWSPSYDFSSEIALRANLGAMAFEKNTGGYFLAFDSSVQVDWRFYDQWSLAVGPGAQYWWDFGGVYAQATGDISYHIGREILQSLKIERVSSGVAWLFDNASTKQVRVAFVFGF